MSKHSSQKSDINDDRDNNRCSHTDNKIFYNPSSKAKAPIKINLEHEEVKEEEKESKELIK